MPQEATRFTIHELTQHDDDWEQYADVIKGEDQEHWAFNADDEPSSRHFAMAKQDGHIVGFLVYVVQEISCHCRSPVTANGETLTEAKITAFGVQEAYRRQGIGRALQEHALRDARMLGCHRVRSVSHRKQRENVLLKLSMGFAVVPDGPTPIFIMPLDYHSATRKCDSNYLVRGATCQHLPGEAISAP